ncbi:Uncharacterized conserved protein, DUF497 family [Oribacterium sp. KHPX15]|uniref:BrnT family toxin n=1 Tax=Oribacterium sp. KHPX15 TaxID=1855342 RepID=UPI00089931D1|nr:BrnT family toxin [Oribacterium sp. KHPX15]SEA27045.1 Uncharacterized conserved protein, DUF497 family [Oribacterium sp. KHPX15]
MSDFNRKEYRAYRKNRQDGDSYFQKGVSHLIEYFSVKEKLFVWDKSKNEANITEHGIDFYTAAYVFNDEFRLEDDNRYVDGELREQVIGEPSSPIDDNHPIDTTKTRPRAVIGEVEGILFVVFVQQVGDFGEETRIISARTANKSEAKTYLMMKYADYLE